MVGKEKALEIPLCCMSIAKGNKRMAVQEAINVLEDRKKKRKGCIGIAETVQSVVISNQIKKSNRSEEKTECFNCFTIQCQGMVIKEKIPGKVNRDHNDSEMVEDPEITETI